MRRTFMITAIAMAAGAPIALGQAANQPPERDRDNQRQHQQPGQDRQMDSVRSLTFLHSDKVIGTEVQGTTGEQIGSMTDLIISASDGKVKYGIISTGGVMGIGDKLVAVPVKQFRYDAVDEVFTCSATESTLEAMPSFDPERWPNLRDQEWIKALSEHGDSPTDRNRDRNRDTDREPDVDIDIDDPMQPQEEDDIDVDIKNRQPSQQDKDRHAMGQGQKSLVRLSDISGTEVKADEPRRPNRPGEDQPGRDQPGEQQYDEDRRVTLESTGEVIGEIDGAVIELTSHQVPFAIISSGGVLGIGGENRLVPWKALTMRADSLVLKGLNEQEFKTLATVDEAEIEQFNSRDDVLAYFEPFDMVQPPDFEVSEELTRAPGGG